MNGEAIHMKIDNEESIVVATGEFVVGNGQIYRSHTDRS
jgi:hypothetical protein